MGPTTDVNQRVPGHGEAVTNNTERHQNQKNDGARGTGVKRKTPCDLEECTNSCDCEDFGLPLAKKINKLNIEYSGGLRSSEPREQDHGGGNGSRGGFGEKYPYPEGKLNPLSVG